MVQYLPQSASSYHFPNVGEQACAKIFSSLNGKLGRQVINRAHENAISFHTIKKRKKTMCSLRNIYIFLLFRNSIRSHSYLSWSMCWLGSYIQKGFSIVVHSVMNSMEPSVSAEMSQIAKNLTRINKEKKNTFFFHIGLLNLIASTIFIKLTCFIFKVKVFSS